jgi:phosphorylcholine metabolism protein LicD
MSLQDKLQKLNFQNLISISTLIKDIEHFIFYGTLLGIVRENNVIKGDDDIDFMVDYKSKKKLLKKMTLNKTFKINKKVSNDFFVQYIKRVKKLNTFVDFYFYVKDTKNSYIIDKHNWLGNIKDKRFALHFPKKMIFPIVKGKKFNLPKKPKAVCVYIYGKTWSTPLTKNTNYRPEVVNNKPVLIRRSYLGSLTRKFKSILNFSNFKKAI